MDQAHANNNFLRQQKIDRLDREFCIENNIILHRISYDDDINLSVQELVEKFK